jgi:hypothetical protein
MLCQSSSIPEGLHSGDRPGRRLITREHTQEALSRAYVHALSGRAGLNLELGKTFDYGIDGSFHPVKIRDGARIETGFPVRFQLKASINWRYAGTDVAYDLDARAHRILSEREPGESLAILILLCLPKDDEHWLTSSETEMYLRHCCYWHRVPGPPTTNTSSQTIRIPRANLLTADALRSIMDAAREEARRGL